MLLIGYRRLIATSLETEATPDDECRKAALHTDRRARRRINRCASELLLGSLLELAASRLSTGWQLQHNDRGKPFLVTADASSEIEVSISHSGRLALAAVTDVGDIGVDLEYRDPRRSIAAIAAYAFGPRERRVVELGGLRAFYRIWTLREALAKAHGVGFPMLADRRDYFAQGPYCGKWQSLIDGRNFLFATTDLCHDYAFAVAISPRLSLDCACKLDVTPREFD